MPKLARSQWYELCRDVNWQFKYVTGDVKLETRR
jgi:hypothetical protein